jgi:hypothetical protein
MMKQLHGTPKKGWVDKASAVLEHYFDNHCHCVSWCKQKLMLIEERDTKQRQPGKYYRCKDRDLVQYELLASIVGKYTMLAKLEEVLHGHSTQLNESLNNSIANKSLSGLKSLYTWVSMAIGIDLVSYQPYLSELLLRMDIPVTNGTLTHLTRMWEMKKKMSTLHNCMQTIQLKAIG